ncbi:hypothetical protein G5I_01583 [Acromyrmex echinatior]|uniref:Uncharacterized protein n=1 Tax=Acromyrmex echinatior TaxID=103372 RepID=F4W806_ACREC|nr:hypothetical protein G5I_01583 [Acromyrmex echinatior]
MVMKKIATNKQKVGARLELSGWYPAATGPKRRSIAGPLATPTTVLTLGTENPAVGCLCAVPLFPGYRHLTAVVCDFSQEHSPFAITRRYLLCLVAIAPCLPRVSSVFTGLKVSPGFATPGSVVMVDTDAVAPPTLDNDDAG